MKANIRPVLTACIFCSMVMVTGLPGMQALSYRGSSELNLPICARVAIGAPVFFSTMISPQLFGSDNASPSRFALFTVFFGNVLFYTVLIRILLALMGHWLLPVDEAGRKEELDDGCAEVDQRHQGRIGSPRDAAMIGVVPRLRRVCFWIGLVSFFLAPLSIPVILEGSEAARLYQNASISGGLPNSWLKVKAITLLPLGYLFLLAGLCGIALSLFLRMSDRFCSGESRYPPSTDGQSGGARMRALMECKRIPIWRLLCAAWTFIFLFLVYCPRPLVGKSARLISVWISGTALPACMVLLRGPVSGNALAFYFALQMVPFYLFGKSVIVAPARSTRIVGTIFLAVGWFALLLLNLSITEFWRY